MDIQIIINLKDRPDAWRPRWYKVLSFVKRQIDRAFYYGLDIPGAMGVDEKGDAYWFEVSGSRLSEEEARSVCLAKGPTWRFRSIPIDGDLPDETCGYLPEEIPASLVNELSLSHRTPLIAQRASQIQAAEERLEMMIDQAGRMLEKNQNRLARSA